MMHTHKNIFEMKLLQEFCLIFNKQNNHIPKTRDSEKQFVFSNHQD
jgi:hypothetical protein